MIKISGLTSSKLKWLSVWCRQYSVNFGDVIFDKVEQKDIEGVVEDFVAKEEEAMTEADSEAETEAEGDTEVEQDVSQTSAGMVKVGEIRTLAYEVSGTVYIVDEKTLKIEDFNYNGKGPDAFFYVGESGSPSGEGTMVPYPEGSDTDTILTKADKIDITLKLPTGR